MLTIVMVTIVMVIKVDGDEMVDAELEYLLSGLSMMATMMTVMKLMMTTVLKN